MKILHTADLHLGQIIYQNYDRSDEHRYFFSQLERWCREERPDALVVSGDVFDIQQPSALVKKAFTDYFVGLHHHCPSMHIIITAGNHDSASRIQADSAVWRLANAHLVGLPPAADSIERDDGWQYQYIVKLDSGYIVALPFMAGNRENVVQSILDKVADDNTDALPVVLMAHQTVTGSDVTGHNFEIGSLKSVEMSAFGHGYDYLALGHIHKPQTIGHQDGEAQAAVCYHAPVARYAGSALHVSCDECYPHSVSLVEVDGHFGKVSIRQLRIEEFRHFYVLPADGTSFTSVEEALQQMAHFVAQGKRGYIRFRFDVHTCLPPNFSQLVYDTLLPYNDEWRYNPKVLWTGQSEQTGNETVKPVFEVAELQQMSDPMVFIERTKDQYPGLDLDDVRQALEEVKAEIRRMDEEKKK